MPSAIPILSAPSTSAPTPAEAYSRPSHGSGAPAKLPPQSDLPPEPAEHHHAAPPPATTALSPQALSKADVSYVRSLMGVIPAQKMEEILLKTGVPIPVNLGPTFDTSA